MPLLRRGTIVKLQGVFKVTVPLVLGAATMSVAQQPTPPITLEVPLACRFGETCFIQQYFDHDPGPGAKDYRCGPMVYDGHDGVDLRVPTMAQQQRGVEVLAAASGVVRAIRDGMNDVSVRVAGADSVKGRECGNGVAVTHPGGWETQYCHMAKGSVRVKTGQAVTTGTPLGLVGMSGNAEFAHLHLTVSHNQQKIDPFAWDSAPGICGSGTHSLWSKDAALALAYHSPDVVNTGFAPGQVTMDDVESGRAAEARPQADSPMIMAYVRPIGLKSGDIQALTLRGPGGVVLARGQTRPLDGDKAQLIYFVGKRRTATAWPAGEYEAQYEVRRDGATALIKRFDFTLR